jgi:acyl dehydratase
MSYAGAWEIDDDEAAQYASLIGADPSEYRARKETHPLALTAFVLRAMFELARDGVHAIDMTTVRHATQNMKFHVAPSPGPVLVEASIGPPLRYGLGAGVPVTCDIARAGAPLASTTALLAVPSYPDNGSLPLPSGPRTPSRQGLLATRSCVVEPAFVDRYAEVSGDHNPIHLDDEAARAAGLRGRIVHGTAVLALSVQCALEVVGGPATARLVEVFGRFSHVVPVGSELSIEIWSTEQPSHVAISVTVANKRVLRDAWVQFERPEPRAS